jgi:uncharacterized protein (TIGR03000 family)
MCRKAFSFGGLLLLAGAAILATPSLGQAQHGGGGHGGGGHFGGGHFGGGRIGGFRGGIFHGGARFGGGRIVRPHYGYRPYYRSYGYYYPYSYGSSGYYPDYDNSYPYVWPSPTYDSGDASAYGDVAPSYADGTTSAAPSQGDYQSLYPPATVSAPSETGAHVTVNVPEDAQLWFNGTLTTSTGTVRQFDSPPFTPGYRYSYKVQARWEENGKEVTQTQRVEVAPGANVSVTFPVPSGTTAQASSTNKR